MSILGSLQPKDLRRFWNYVERSNACWLWIGPKNQSGYGILRIGSLKNQTRARHTAHRISWAIHYGEPNDGCVCHHCDVPACVRPDHLFLGSIADNHADMVKKGRNVKGDAMWNRMDPTRVPRGSKHSNSRFTEDQIREMRAAVAAGETQEAVAKRFVTSQPVVCNIVRRKTWKHI